MDCGHDRETIPGEMEVRIREQGILYYMVKPFEAENFRSLLEHLTKKSTGVQKWTGVKPSL